MSMSVHKLVPILLLVVLAGCKVSKDLSIPKDSIPETFRNVNTTGDTSSVARLSVKEFFKDPHLQSLLDTALLKNNDLQVALKNMESAELNYKQSRLGNLPQLNLQVTANSNRPSDNSLNGLSTSQFLNTSHVEDYNANLGLSWEADIWSKIKSRKQAALAGYLQTTEAKKAIQTRLVASIASGYYRLMMLDAQLAIAKRNLSLNDSTLNIIRMQYSAGQVTSLAIQQAEAQQMVAAQLIPSLEQQIAVQENGIRILTGNFPGSISRSSSLAEVPLDGTLTAGVPSEMVARRPDVRSAELQLNIANAEVGVSKANLYPSLTITAAGGLNSFKASNWFTMPASLFGTVAGGLTQPIFQRRMLRTNYERSLIEREKTVIQFRQSVLVAAGEVSDELVRIEKLNLQFDIASRRTLTLNQALRNAGLLFKNGMANYLEVITAQSNSLQSELDLATIRTERLTAAVSLYRALGGGF
nr:efflux transporter outer membrane subunit [Pedobacter sp. BAL39]